MSREKLLEEIWREEIKDEILTCVVIKKEKDLRNDCQSECEFYPICKRIISMEKESK